MSRKSIPSILEEVAELRRRRDFSAVAKTILDSGVTPESSAELGVELVAAWNKLRLDQNALLLANQLVADFPKVADPIRWRRLHILRAMALIRFGRISEAEKDVELVLLGGYASLDRFTAEATDLTGIIFNVKGYWDAAESAFLRALAQYKLLGYHRGVAAANHNLGMSLCYRQRFAEAEQQFVAASSYYVGEGTIVDNIGTALERAIAVLGLNDITRAHTLAQWGLQKTREVGAEGMLGDALRTSGAVLSAAERFDEANAALEEAAEHASGANNRHLMGEVAETVGDMETARGNRSDALQAYESAQQRYAEVGAIGFESRVAKKCRLLNPNKSPLIQGAGLT